MQCVDVSADKKMQFVPIVNTYLLQPLSILLDESVLCVYNRYQMPDRDLLAGYFASRDHDTGKAPGVPPSCLGLFICINTQSLKHTIKLSKSA